MLIPFSDCHYWTGSLANYGYGEFKIGGRKERAHRVAYARRYGSLPRAGQVLRHTCDQPLCVNTDHLVVGTQAENAGDAAARQRMPMLRAHWNGKLSAGDVSEILKACARGEDNTTIGRRHGVGSTRISMIRNGHVGPNHPAYRGVK